MRILDSHVVQSGGKLLKCANVDGSLSAMPGNCFRNLPTQYPSWIEFWESMTSGESPQLCSMQDCTGGKDAAGHPCNYIKKRQTKLGKPKLLGLHVWTKDQEHERRCWIVPGCSSCNAPRGTYDLLGVKDTLTKDPPLSEDRCTQWMTLRAGTLLVPAPVTFEMLAKYRATRRQLFARQQLPKLKSGPEPAGFLDEDGDGGGGGGGRIDAKIFQDNAKVHEVRAQKLNSRAAVAATVVAAAAVATQNLSRLLSGGGSGDFISNKCQCCWGCTIDGSRR